MIVPEPGNPQAFNKYTFVLGNPLRYIDPSGFGICDSPGGAANPDCQDWIEDTTQEEDSVVVDPNPYWDKEHDVVRHLVESCGPLECIDAILNGYVPGAWNFWLADQWRAATSQIYLVGPVARSEALEAAEAGEPNPLSEEQFNTGLNQRPNRDLRAEVYFTLYVKQWAAYGYLFDELEFSDRYVAYTPNYEPVYLAVLIQGNPAAANRAHEEWVEKYTNDPDMLDVMSDPWALYSGR